jgi:hypothetical protein
MRGTFLIIAILPALLFGQAGTQKDDVWAPLRFIVGAWEGSASSHSIEGRATCEGRFLFNGAFLQLESKDVFAPREEMPQGLTHEDIGIFSYDRERKTLVLRQFHCEGFVNQYVLDSLSTGGTTIAFISERLENFPPGWRAKVQFEIFNDNEFVELYKLAPPEGELEVYSESHLTRKDR